MKFKIGNMSIIASCCLYLSISAVSVGQGVNSNAAVRRKAQGAIELQTLALPIRPVGTKGERIDDAVTSGNLVFKFICYGSSEGLPAYVRPNDPTADVVFHVLRVYRKSPIRLLREVWNDQLPVDDINFNCSWPYGRCGGLSFLLYDPIANRVYCTLCSEDARDASFEIFSIGINDGLIRHVGAFDSRGGGYGMPSISPDGKYLAIVVQVDQSIMSFVRLIDLDTGTTIRENPISKELQDKCSPQNPFEIKAYKWGNGELTCYMGPITSGTMIDRNKSEVAHDVAPLKQSNLNYTLKSESAKDWIRVEFMFSGDNVWTDRRRRPPIKNVGN